MKIINVRNGFILSEKLISFKAIKNLTNDTVIAFENCEKSVVKKYILERKKKCGHLEAYANAVSIKFYNEEVKELIYKKVNLVEAKKFFKKIEENNTCVSKIMKYINSIMCGSSVAYTMQESNAAKFLETFYTEKVVLNYGNFLRDLTFYNTIINKQNLLEN